MSDFQKQAGEKLDKEYKAGKYDRYAQIMKESVLNMLKEFCEQEEELAQAVVQGGSFEDCMKAVAKNCGTWLPDPEAYRRAVQFFFPGAEVRCKMTVDLIGAAAEPYTPKHAAEGGGKGIMLDFTDFL